MGSSKLHASMVRRQWELIEVEMEFGWIPTWLQEFEKEASYTMKKGWWSYNLYKKLWSIIGGRPWTYIYRDIWHKVEWFAQMQWLLTGAIGYALGGWKGLLIFTAIYTYGYINGHFFWGKKYQPGQQGG